MESIAERSTKLETAVRAFHQSYPARSLDSVARAELARAQALLEKTRIRAPIDGIVLKRELRERFFPHQTEAA